MSLEANKAIVRSFLENSNKEERTHVELCDPSFTAHIGDSPVMNLQSFEQFQVMYFAGFSGSRITIKDMVAEGDRVAFRGVVRATHSADFMGAPASN